MSTLYVDNLQPNLGSRVMAAGHVVQVVTYQNTSYLNTQTTGWMDTGATVSITPTSTSSKIIIFYNESFQGDVDVDSTDVRGRCRLLRGTTEIIAEDTPGGSFIASRGGQQAASMTSIVYEDSPNTTSTVTYKGQAAFISSSGSRNFRVNYNKLGNITVMEIAQ
jgi:hypothetical protein